MSEIVTTTEVVNFGFGDTTVRIFTATLGELTRQFNTKKEASEWLKSCKAQEKKSKGEKAQRRNLEKKLATIKASVEKISQIANSIDATNDPDIGSLILSVNALSDKVVYVMHEKAIHAVKADNGSQDSE